MADICRLCLSFSKENMLPLSDCSDSVNTILCLSLHMPSNNLFPNQICAKCISKITEFNDFRLYVHKNEETLHQIINHGLEFLNKFYDDIRGIKKNNGGCKNSEDGENNASVLTDILNEIKTETEEDFNLHENVEYNSEDELPLTEMKDLRNQEIELRDIKPMNERFKCLTCFENFEAQNSLVKHYNNVHKSQMKMENSYTLITEEEGNSLYKCDKCDKKYDHKRKIKKHVQVHTEERFHCKICSRTYKTVSEIIRHSRAHFGVKLSCSFGCGFTTVYSGALKSHEVRHGKGAKYKCETCQKSFQVKTWYEQHQNIHKGVKPYVCDICGLSFHMDRYLTSHRSSVHPDASSLDRYVCVQCSKPCGNMKALTLHCYRQARLRGREMKRCFTQGVVEVGPPSEEHGITASLLCDLCGKTLNSSEQLKIHRRMHLGIKPFSCTTCDKSFSKKCHLSMHSLTHTGERAHACQRCGKRYTQRSALSRHIHRHHGEGTKKCFKCNQTFSTIIQLQSHQKLCS